ncbi:MAG: hypothetical protein SFT93_05465 [Rickettsiaceae bacterium]|nr:hypothetical protein [Rickettsiaceae bacterium]
MNQNNLFLSLFTRIFVFILISIIFAFLYNQVSDYNLTVNLEISNYSIKTYIGTLVFLLVLPLTLLLFIINLLSKIIFKINLIRRNYQSSRASRAVNQLIESCLIFSFNNKKDTIDHLKSIDQRYLSEDQKEYVDLVLTLASSDTIPISLYSYIQKYPIVKKQISKKLAEMEFKLGNIERAHEYAVEYYSIAPNDSSNNILLAKIHAKHSNYKAIDKLIFETDICSITSEAALAFSEIYFAAAKEAMAELKNSEALTYCSKALDVNPKNLAAAEFFAEIAAAQRSFSLITEILIPCFAKAQDFNLFLIIKKFSNLTDIELYNELMYICSENYDLGVFLAIATYLELGSKKQELLDQII